jgi:glycosyltransferase involved in cell wall biosynthesis
MKIAILTSGILPVPAVQGGAVENLIDYYLEYNEKHKQHDITVFSIYHKAVENHPALHSKVNHYVYIDTTTVLSKLERKFRQLFITPHGYYNEYIEYFFYKVYSILIQQHYDLIILENRPGYAIKLSQYGYKNILLHLHNDLLNSHTPYNQTIANSLKRIITVSNYIKQTVETIPGAFSKTHVVYNGIDTSVFNTSLDKKTARHSIGISPDEFVITYTGRLIPEKGIMELLQAFHHLSAHEDIRLYIIGNSFFDNISDDDNFTRQLKTIAKDFQKQIVFTGYVAYKDISTYLTASDIAVVPSVWEEPFGLTCIEAMACGLPLVATHTGGIPEIANTPYNILINKDKDIALNIANAILRIKQNYQAYLGNSLPPQFSKEHYAEMFFKCIEDTYQS